jgi:hypothetical protein
MIGFSILSNLFDAIINTGYVTGVYHTVIQKKDSKGHIYPVAPVGNKFKPLGPNDSKGFYCYCRQVGTVDNIKEERIGGCNGKEYTLQIQHRLVFYNQDEERNHEDIFALMMKAVMSIGATVKFQKGITVPEQVAIVEAPTGKYSFQVTTFYRAIEFFVLLKLQADDCEAEIRCKGVANPYCKPVAQA